VFRGLSWAAKDSLVDLRIYYASLQYTTPIVEHVNGFEVAFIQGASLDPSRKFRLFVQTIGWKDSEIEAIRHEMKLTQGQTQSTHEKKGKATAGKKGKAAAAKTEEPLVFFVGRPSNDDPLLFIAEHPRAVCSFRQVYRNLGGEPDPLPQGQAVPQRPAKTSVPTPSSESVPPEEAAEPVASPSPAEPSISTKEREVENLNLPMVNENTAGSALDRPKSFLDRVRAWFRSG
jgi:hypothetical protein